MGKTATFVCLAILAYTLAAAFPNIALVIIGSACAYVFVSVIIDAVKDSKDER
jgi:hypothetical protein